MLWVSYFWQLPEGSPMEGFVNIFDEDTFEEKKSFESFSSNQNKDFVSNNIYFLVQQKWFNKIFYVNPSAQCFAYFKYLINVRGNYFYYMCFVINFDKCTGSLLVTPLNT